MIFVQFSHILGIQKEDVYSEYINEYENACKEEESENFSLLNSKDRISLMVVNPDQKKYYQPPCPLCGSRDCKNCPLRISKENTLDNLMHSILNLNKFDNNDILFKEKDYNSKSDSSDDP